MAHYFWPGYVLFAVSGLWMLGQWWHSDYRSTGTCKLHNLKKRATRINATDKNVDAYNGFRAKYWSKEIAFPIVIISIPAALLWWTYQEQVEVALGSYEGWFEPGIDPTPSNPCGVASQGSLLVLLGKNAAYATKFPSTIISINGLPELLLDRNDNGEIAITTDIYDAQHRIVAEIKNNKFVLANDVFRHRRKDFSSLTVVIKDHKETVLDIQYLNRSAVKIAGVFRSPGEPTLTVSDEELKFGGRIIPWHSVCSGDNGGAQFAFRSRPRQ